MQDDRCTRIGEGTAAFGGSPDGGGEDAGVSCIVTVAGSPDIDGEGDRCTGAWDPDKSIGCASWGRGDGLACKEARCGAESVGFSCKLDRGRGEGVVISNVDAAQSQLLDREP